MIANRLVYFAATLIALANLSCGAERVIPPRDIETSFAFTNFSRSTYAALGIRANDPASPGRNYFLTPLLPPGATFRMRFLGALDLECPDSLDVRIYHYRRIREDIPIGLDPGEELEPSPIVVGELIDIPACAVTVLETFTIVNWDAPPGLARLKFAQATAIDDALALDPRFDNIDVIWETQGIDQTLPVPDVFDRIESAPVAGRVLDVSGAGVENVGVLIRTRFRVRLTDGDPQNDPDVGFSDPINVMTTAADGSFSFDRPPGAYRVEFFSDDWLFRPAFIDVETPQSNITTIVEPIP